MGSKNNIGLVEYAKAQLGRPYWYGTYGQVSNPSLLTNKKRQYPSYYTASDFGRQMGVKVHDCIGLVKGYMWCESPDDPKPVYCSNGFPDVSADMQFNRSKFKGYTMATLPKVAGVLVFMKGHVGISLGDGWVIEARGHMYGVVKTKLERRPWKRWAYVDEIEYVEPQPQGNAVQPEPSVITNKGCAYK